MFCPKCGKENSDNASFCTHCGYSTHSNISSRKKQKPNNAKITVLVILIAIILSIIFGLISYLAFLPKDKKTSSSTDATLSDVLEKDSDDESDSDNSSDDSKNDTKKDSEKEKEAEADKSETPAPTLTPEKKTTALLEDMSSADKKTLNTFLSNFSEATYKIDNQGSEILDKLFFAFIHNLINNKEKIIYKDDNMGISAKDVDETLMKYFGSSIPHTTPQQETSIWTYEDGLFMRTPGDGEFIGVFSVATDMKKNANGTFTVMFNVYNDPEASPTSINPDWYSYTPDEASEKCDYWYSGTAIVKEKNYNGKDTYELVSYAVEQY